MTETRPEHDGLMVPAQPTSHRSQDFWSTFAGVAGNILEWYDFAVFGYFSDTIGQVFFPHQDGDMATVESFMVFGGAFLMRPVGGVLLGYIGDVYGPKKALIISIFLMAFPVSGWVRWWIPLLGVLSLGWLVLSRRLPWVVCPPMIKSELGRLCY